MLRQNPHRHVVQECGVRGGETEGDGVIVFHRDFLDIFKVRRVLRAVVGVHDGLNREFHVVCGEALAVVPRDVGAQMEGVGVGSFIKVPAFGETRNDVVFAVVGGEAVEDEEVDLAVLVHRGVDARVVG